MTGSWAIHALVLLFKHAKAVHGVMYIAVGSEAAAAGYKEVIGIRKHTSREKFLACANYNPRIMTRFKFVGSTRTIIVTPRGLPPTVADFAYMYDELLPYCSCGKAGSRANFTDIPDLDDGFMV